MIFAMVFDNDCVSQVAGLKANFSQPHFVFWDKLLGTYMSREELEKIKAARKMKSQ